jgi:2-phosphosulfolactate phosphatase
MHIDTVLTPAEIDHLPERDLSGATCVVFDVLRATSSIVTGLAHGVREIHPVESVEEALALRAALGDAVLGGERHGDRIEGFDVGNSPLEYLHLAGRRVITTTTNGTVALRAVGHASRVLVGALLNLDAVAQHVAAARPERVVIVCAGTFRGPALEDILAAGALADALEEMLGRPGAAASGGAAADTVEVTDATRAAQAVHRRACGNYQQVLQDARNGRALTAKGRADEVAFCAQRSRWPVVGSLRGGAIVSIQT